MIKILRSISICLISAKSYPVSWSYSLFQRSTDVLDGRASWMEFFDLLSLSLSLLLLFFFVPVSISFTPLNVFCRHSDVFVLLSTVGHGERRGIFEIRLIYLFFLKKKISILVDFLYRLRSWLTLFFDSFLLHITRNSFGVLRQNERWLYIISKINLVPVLITYVWHEWICLRDIPCTMCD